MPLNYKILDWAGTTSKRLEQIFTASPAKLSDAATDEERKAMDSDYKLRLRIEDMIQSRMEEGMLQNLRASHLIAAVDLAWDSSTITRKTIPLVMYAQGRLDLAKCVRSLEQLKCRDDYVKTRDNTVVGLDVPRFSEVNINILRSVISRRVAAQSARYSNLYPFFRYEPRGTSEVEKLQGDLLSQRSDIMADQFGYREQQIQWMRDMLMYPYSVVFPACRWEREVEWVDANDNVSMEYRTSEVRPEAVVKREGVPMICPHPSRVAYDSAHPIQTLNSDSGCEFIFFWDVVRYSQIASNASYFNRSEITYGGESSGWFYSYRNYFSQYYTTIRPPLEEGEISSGNDRKEDLRRYSTSMADNAVYLAHYYWKVTPNQWDMGKYPWPVWLHLTVANCRTVVHAEIMPDCPAFVFAFNNSAQRAVNLSMGAELLPFNDQLTNLYTQLLECTKRDLFGIAMLNIDAFPSDNPDVKKSLEEFRAAMKSENFYAAISILEVSFIKMRELGVDLDNVFKVIRQTPNTQVNTLINAIQQTIMMAERIMAMSPQEQAQLSPRETSATEVQVIAGTTENVYQFISDAVDAGRAAMKRYIYNALMSFGSDQIRLPVVNRYRRETAIKAGFTIEEIEGNPSEFRVIGSKRSLNGDYIFSSRDGAERSSNIQSAQTLTQLLGVLMQPAVLSMLTKEKLADLINVIVRQSGAGVDVTVEPAPGEGGMPVMPPALPPAAVGPGAEAANAVIPKQ